MNDRENAVVAGCRLLKRTGLDGAGGFGLGYLYDTINPSGQRVSRKLTSLDALPRVRIKDRNQHPNLVHLLGYWTVNHQGEIVHGPDTSFARPAAPEQYQLVIATDLHIGIPVGTHQGQAPMPLPELLRYLEDIAPAVDFLNAPKYVEGMGMVTLCCDVTPHSIMLTPHGARLDDLNSGIFSNAAEPGRLVSAYSAPENIEGSPGNSSSQYSLATTYYHLRYRPDPWMASWPRRCEVKHHFSSQTYRPPHARRFA